MDEASFERIWDRFERHLDDARRLGPRVRAVSYEALMEARDPEVVRGLFEFIGLPDFWPDFSGQALKAKRPRCHLCDFHDARVALITTSPTPEPVFGNSTAATRSHARAARAARHPEGKLFLGFLLALLVLVAVLAAPCQRRALGDAVLLPDEEDL